MSKRHEHRFHLEDIQMVNKHVTLFLASLAIREIQIKTIRDITAYLSEWLKWKFVTTPNSDKDSEKLNHSYIAVGNVNWYSHSGKEVISHKAKCTITISQRNKNVYSHKNLYKNVYSSFTYNSLKHGKNPDVLQRMNG